MKFRNPVLAPLLAVAKARALWQGRGTAPAEVGEQAEVVEELGVWRPFKQEMAHLIEAIACAHAAEHVAEVPPPVVEHGGWVILHPLNEVTLMNIPPASRVWSNTRHFGTNTQKNIRKSTFFTYGGT